MTPHDSCIVSQVRARLLEQIGTGRGAKWRLDPSQGDLRKGRDSCLGVKT
jgi:hypothetical protein